MTADELRQRALRLLAQRDHSRAELLQKLAPYGTPEEILGVIDRMASLELQSDRRFAEQFVRSRATRLGAARLERELHRRGISRELAQQAMRLALDEGELDRARRVWRGKFAQAPEDPREWARQARFLQYRGFSGEVIRRLLRESRIESA